VYTFSSSIGRIATADKHQSEDDERSSVIIVNSIPTLLLVANKVLVLVLVVLVESAFPTPRLNPITITSLSLSRILSCLSHKRERERDKVVLVSRFVEKERGTKEWRTEKLLERRQRPPQRALSLSL